MTHVKFLSYLGFYINIMDLKQENIDGNNGLKTPFVSLLQDA